LRLAEFQNGQNSPITMKTSRIILLSSSLLCLALAAGCDTPDSRIRNSPDIFARLTPDQQALVKAGQIAVGFDMNAVKLALGDPTRVTVNTDKFGQHEVWHYTTYEDASGVVIYTGYYHRWGGWGGPVFWGPNGYYNGYPVRVHDRIRVDFDINGRVSSIQQEKP
jgi:outer membrane protein assembly factor BamE (lipoprotein component of BamABCDE complex)